MTEDEAEKIIQDWVFYWMKQKDYFQRAMSVDANMRADLAKRISETKAES